MNLPVTNEVDTRTLLRAVMRGELDAVYALVDSCYELVLGPGDGLCNTGWWTGDKGPPPQALARQVLDLVGPGEGKRLLEVPACGGGYAALDHPATQAEWVGIELDAGRVEEARVRCAGRPHQRFIQADARELSEHVEPNSFDVALVVELLPDLSPQLTRDIYRSVIACLAPGGRLIAVDYMGQPGTPGLVTRTVSSVYERLFTVHMQDVAELEALFEAEGLEIVERHDWTDPVLGGCARQGLSDEVQAKLRAAQIPLPARAYLQGWFRAQTVLIERERLCFRAIVAQRPLAK